jgi:DNA excision repair protein ERCC-2
MEIDGSSTTVRISVREFAEFSLSPVGAGSYRPWRAQLGSAWHRSLQSEKPSVDAEISISAVWTSTPWRFEFQGRVDQLWRDPVTGGLVIREIKTVDDRLPLEAAAIRDRCNAYFRQLATYMVLLPVLPEYSDSPSVSGELVLVDIRSGVRQTIPLEHDFRPLFDQQLHRLVDFLERRRQRIATFHSIEIHPPFSEWRDGQPEAVAQLEGHSVSDPFIFFEAPTGFGKTGVVLHFALKQMQRGVFSRVIYLTGKSTGQIQVLI